MAEQDASTDAPSFPAPTRKRSWSSLLLLLLVAAVMVVPAGLLAPANASTPAPLPHALASAARASSLVAAPYADMGAMGASSSLPSQLPASAPSSLAATGLQASHSRPSPSSSSPTTALAGSVGPVGSVGPAHPSGSALLSEASASLSRGEGPADGATWSCLTAGSLTTGVSCSDAQQAAGPSPQTTIGTYPEAYVAGSPMPRAGGVMVYDEFDGYVVLFGGYGGSQQSYVFYSGDNFGTDQGETWEYSVGGWSLLHPAHAPSARNGASMMYDNVFGRVILFGGLTCNVANCPIAFNDTWAFQRGDWTEINSGATGAPPARWRAEMAFNRSGQYGLLFGGEKGFGPTMYRDMWSFNVYTDSWTNQTWWSGIWSFPAGRDLGAFAWDGSLHGSTGAFVLFGGYAQNPSTGSDLTAKDTWVLSYYYYWQNVSSLLPLAPPGLGEAATAYSVSSGTFWMVGGYNWTTGQFYNTTWELTSAPGPAFVQWSECTGCGRLPVNGTLASLVWDPQIVRFIYWGGQVNQTIENLSSGNQVGNYFSGLMFTSMGGPWLDASYASGPGNRSQSMMTYDTADAVVVLFGGYSPTQGCWPYLQTGYCGDTWTYKAGLWSLFGSTGPASRAGGAMVYDPTIQRVVLTGGYTKNCLACSASYFNDTWTFSTGSGWALLHPGGSSCTTDAVDRCPASFENASSTFDGRDNGLVVFGGMGWNPTTFPPAAAVTLCLTYYFSFTTSSWFNASAATPCNNPAAPGGRSSGQAYYSYYDGYVEIFGGLSPSGVPIDDGVWGFQVGPGWTQHCVSVGCTRIGPLYGATVLQEPGSDWWWIYGGKGDSQVVNNTYWNIPCAIFCGGFSLATAQANAAPTMFYGSGATDLADDVNVLFGGQATPTATWIWQRFPPLAVDPSATNFGPLSYVYTTDFGQAVTFSPTAQDGQLPYQYLWQGLPNGCVAPNWNGSFTCTPTTTGTFWVTDTLLQGNGVPASVSRAAQTVIMPDPTVSLHAASFQADVGQTFSLAAQGNLGIAPYTYSWQGLPQGVSCPGTSGGCVFQAYAKDVGTWTVMASVIDQAGMAASSVPITLTIHGDPTVSTPSLSRTLVDVGQSLTLSTIPSGGLSPYALAWSGLGAVGCASSNAASWSCVPTAAGTGTASVSIADQLAFSNSSTATQALTVLPDPSVSAFSSSVPSLDLGSGSATFSIFVVGGSGAGSYSYAWSGLPTGCQTFANVSAVVCTPSAAGTYASSVKVTDALGFVLNSPTLSFTVYPALQAGSVSASPSGLDDNQTVTLTSTSAGGGSGGYVYSWNNLPSGCTSLPTLSLNCKPAVGSVTCFPVTLAVTDSNGVVASSSPVSVCVYPDPTLTTPVATPGSIDVGQSTSLSATGTPGSGGDTYAWAGLPPGCGTASALAISCTPTSPGTYTVYLTVRDSNGFTVTSAGLTLTVSPDPTVSMPGATRTSLDEQQTTTLSVSYTSGSGGLAVHWYGLPAGCSGGGSSTFACTPALGSAGVYFVTVSVIDSNGFNATSTALILYLSPMPTVSSLSGSVPAMDVGETLTLTATGTSGSGSLTFSWAGLPTGCAGSAAWSITCVPTGTGTFSSVDLTVTDSNGGSASWAPALSVTVYPDPTISPISANRTSLDVRQSASLSVTATAPAGGATYAWSGLPAGCASGNSTSLSCSPTSAGTYVLRVTVLDGNGVSATSDTITLVVSPALGSGTLTASISALDVQESTTLSASVAGGTGSYSYLWTGLPRGCVSVDAPTLDCAPTSAGTTSVSVAITDSNGATTSASLPLTVNPALGVSVAASPLSATSGTNVLFTATATGGTGTVSYAWYLNGSLVGAATGATFTLTSPGAGTYTVVVTVTDGTGAHASSPTVSVVVSPPAVKAAVAPPAPFATPAEYLLMAMLAVVILLGLLLVVLLLRRGRRGGAVAVASAPAAGPAVEPTAAPAPEIAPAMAPSPAPAPAPASEAASAAPAGKENEYRED